MDLTGILPRPPKGSKKLLHGFILGGFHFLDPLGGLGYEALKMRGEMRFSCMITFAPSESCEDFRRGTSYQKGLGFRVYAESKW